MTDVFFTSDGGGAAIVTQRKCADGAFVRKDGVIIEYRLEGADPKSPPLKMRSPGVGVVQYKPGTKRLDRLEEGAPLCSLNECTHGVVMKDMCATCGENLREKDGRPGERKTTTTASVPMKHSLPELLVSDEIAKADGEKHKAACLAARKLVLLVDLDQTVIHTTNRQPSADQMQHPDITHFQLYGGNHWTKLRPHTKELFENLSSLYEMHIITFGQRQYAHKIAEIIDPTKHIFLDRILSRDESLSLEHKTANLAALFPAGEEMVAIIDDRADVWTYIDSLIQLRPYKYFREVDDINAPPGAAERRPEQQAEAPPPPAVDQPVGEEGEGGQPDQPGPAAAPTLPVETDETLVHVEKVLKKVHESFYNHYDQTGKVRDLKLIIRNLRQQTLKGYIIVLSGLVPVDTNPQRVDAYRIAVAFGATVTDKVDEQTTHVVAARWGTTKVYDARRLNVPIVKPRWLYACMELWEKAPEQPYLLTEESARPALETSGADMAMMGADLLSDMNKEMESLSDEDESDEEDEEEEGDAESWKDRADRVRAPEVARPKIDESRVKRKLPVEALDRGYTGESAGEEEDDDPFGGTSSKRSKKRRSSEEEREDREERDDEADEDAAEPDYGDDNDEALEDEDDDGDMDDMAAELEHQLEH